MRIQDVANAIVGEAKPALFESKSIAGLDKDTAKEQQMEYSIAELTRKAQDFSSNNDLWTKLLALLEQTRIATKEHRWIAAQQSFTEATVRVNRAIASETLSGVRVRLAFLPLAWFIFMFGLQSAVEWMSRTSPAQMWVDTAYFQYLWMGMLGGTTVVLWGIVKHGTNMTFDRSYVIWYVFKPALGAIMGMLVVMIVQAGFLTVGSGATKVDINRNIPLWVLAFVGGFSERFFIQVIDRVVTSVLGGEKAPSTETMSVQTRSRVQETPPVQPTTRNEQERNAKSAK